MVVKEHYICSIRVDNNWYWNQHPQQHVIKVTTRTIIHPQLEVSAVTDFHTIPKGVCIRTQAKNSISIQPICLTGYEYDYILEEIGLQDKIDFEREV